MFTEFTGKNLPRRRTIATSSLTALDLGRSGIALASRPWRDTSPCFGSFDAGSPLPQTTRTDVMLLLLRHMWKARNALIFYHKNSTPSDILRRVIHCLDNWSCRFRRLVWEVDVWKDWIHAKIWCNSPVLFHVISLFFPPVISGWYAKLCLYLILQVIDPNIA